MVDCTLTPSKGGAKFDREGDNLGPKDYYGWGCSGAWMWHAWNFQRDHGAILEADYPYTSGSTGKESPCQHNTIAPVNDQSKIFGFISHYTKMYSVTQMKNTVE